jgi:FlaA1/EpsC-like NDP-sugar epimerase
VLYQLKNPKFYLMMASDAALMIAALIGAYLLRFDFVLGPYYTRQIELLLAYILPSKLVVFYLLGLYKGMWRYSSAEDFWRLAQGAFASMLLVVGIVLYLHRFEGFPRSVFLIDAGLTFVLTGGLRMAIRSFYAARNTSKGVQAFCVPGLGGGRRGCQRVVIVGAGSAGEKILREIFDSPQLQYYVVGFLDDDPGKRGRAVHGITVLGKIETLPEVIEEYEIEQVFISIPSATGPQMRKILDVCEGCGVAYKTLPAIGEIMNGKVSIKSLRDVSFEDLLGRSPVKLDTAGISNCLAGRTVMVTGCGGSIGSELCRQLVSFRPERLILLDSSEANLFMIQMELHHELKFTNYQCVLCRVQDKALMHDVFGKYRPQVILHAAAYKHVPMLEINPWEAVFNNILGSQTIMEMAVNHGAERFVLVSTDKAVRPTNVMGTSKRVTELLLQSFQGNGTRLMAVRFGNVVGSSGSVIPLFRRQIEQGGPVTVTHPDVTRFFMTIPEAAQLILQAGALGQGGEIFVLEMGTPVKIADMARDLIKLSGKEPEREIEIVYTGLREGEKLYEELITADENIVATQHEKIMVLKPNGNLNAPNGQVLFCEQLNGELVELYRMANKHDALAIKTKLKQIVPEYTPQKTVSAL